MANSTECVRNPNGPKEYKHKIFNKLSGSSHPFGTLKTFHQFTNEYQYDIHNFVKEKRKCKSVYIGEWRVNRTDEDQNYDSSKMHTIFEVDLTRLKENSSGSNFRAWFSIVNQDM